MNLKKVKGQGNAGRAYPDELHDPLWLRQGQSLGDQLRLADGLAGDVRTTTLRQFGHGLAERHVRGVDDGGGAQPGGNVTAFGHRV